jgi:hypothetical protein
LQRRTRGAEEDFMSEMIVSCAGCGKRYRGTPGSKKFKCTHCQNLLTFPETPRSATVEGTVLCSFCWSDVPHDNSLMTCPTCSQKVWPRFGGRCTPFGEASSSSQRMANVLDENKSQGAISQIRQAVVIPTPPQGVPPTSSASQSNASQAAVASAPPTPPTSEADAKTKKELEAKVNELLRLYTTAQTEQAMHRMDADRATRQYQEAQKEVQNLRRELEDLRNAAVHALEPLAEDYSKLMKKVASRVEDLEVEIRKTQEESMTRLQELRQMSDRLKENIELARREFATRLAQIIGADADLTPIPGSMPAPSSNASLQAVLGGTGR